MASFWSFERELPYLPGVYGLDGKESVTEKTGVGNIMVSLKVHVCEVEVSLAVNSMAR